MTNREWIGDYDLRGVDVETALIGPVTDRIIDADRLVRFDFRNGMPNWMLYRSALAGDSIYLRDLRDWAVLFALEMCNRSRLHSHPAKEDMACVAAWDALHLLVHMRQLQPYTQTAEALGVHHKTYRRLRDSLAATMHLSLKQYWLRLISAYCQVLTKEREPERKCGSAFPVVCLS